MRLPAALLTLTLFALARGQATAAWSNLHVANGVAISSVGNVGKTICYHEAGQLHAWSAVTREWRVTTVGSSAIRVFNDCLVAVGAAGITAFSSYRGRFESLPVSASALVLNPASNTNDSVVLVLDGTQLHAFSAFVGTWTTRSVGAAFHSAVQRHVALIADSNVLSGYDAETGQWLDLVLPTSATALQLSCDGTAAMAFSNGGVHAFSGNARTWSTARLPAAATFVRGDDWGLWFDANRMLGYSSLQNRFTAFAGGASTAVANDLFALATTTTDSVAFSAITGAFTRVAAAGATLTAGTSVALLADAQGLHAYSAVNDRVATQVVATTSQGAAGTIAFARPAATGHPMLFSGLTGIWHPAPASALPIDPAMTTTSAALLTNTGLLAFAARSGTFVPLARPGLAFTSNTASAPLLAFDATHLFAFDSRSARWQTITRSGTSTPQVQIWRTAALVIDGGSAFGFGAQGGTWSQQTLPGPIMGIRANSESCRVISGNELLVFSALPEVIPFAQFPEFRRVQPRNGNLRIVLPVPATALAVLGVGRLATSPVPVPGLGELLLDAVGLVTVPVPSTPTGEPARMVFTLPSAPPLVGLEVGLQAVVLRNGQAPWLTAASTVLLL